MALPAQLQNLRLPAVAAPLFIISNPKLVIASTRQPIPPGPPIKPRSAP